ncbi:MAG: WGR domain-containing protein [Thiolinea sp.]
MITYLKKVDPEKNQYRFYSLYIVPTLFGEWSLVRTWGRIGSGGAIRSDWFDTEKEAQDALEVIEKQKRRKGYS